MANVVGSVVLGWVATLLLQTPASNDQQRGLLALSSGFCGSLTTFSSFVVDVAENLRSGSLTAGLGSLVASVVLGGLAVLLGHRLAAGSEA